MKIHEYQAMELLRAYGAPVPRFGVAAAAEQAAELAQKYGRCVLKAQVHSGGRGRAGGVRLAENAGEARAIAGKMLGMRLVTRQTGPEGRIVRRLLVTPAAEIKKEFYLSVTGDNENASLVIIASAEGGIEIEETADVVVVNEKVASGGGHPGRSRGSASPRWKASSAMKACRSPAFWG